MEIEVLDGGRLQVAATHRPLLRANGLDTFARVMALPEGQLKRDFPGRRTSRLELALPGGGTQAVYLKRYHPEYLSLSRRLLRRLGWPGSGDEARAEWEAVQAVAALGIPTLDLVAFGQDTTTAGAVRSSFVMTAELTGAEEGHRYAAGIGSVERRHLLERVARFTRNLHNAGLVHKDLYLCHYMVAPARPEPSIFLIDLQRMTRPRYFMQRWRVKDLAALTYSSLKAGATWKDVVAAFRIYRGDGRLQERDRQLAQEVTRRIDWLKSRTPRHDTDFEQLQ